jgi:hypothetical protein
VRPPPASGERDPGADQDAAVAAQHEWSLASVEDRAEAVGQPAGVIDDRVLIAQPTRPGFHIVDVPARQHHAAIRRTAR